MVLTSPETEEHLIVAAGRRVYALYDDRLECVATRPGNVTGLAVYNDALVDSGNYRGVFDTVTGKRLRFDTDKVHYAQKWADITACTNYDGSGEKLLGVSLNRIYDDGRDCAGGDHAIVNLTSGRRLSKEYGDLKGHTKRMSGKGYHVALAGTLSAENVRLSPSKSVAVTAKLPKLIHLVK